MKTITADIPDDLYNTILDRRIPIEFSNMDELITKALRKLIAVETRKILRQRIKNNKIKKFEVLKEINEIRYGN